MRIPHQTPVARIKKYAIFVASGMTFALVTVLAVPEDRGPHAPITQFLETDVRAITAKYMNVYVIVV